MDTIKNNGRPRKYRTEAERKKARKEAADRWYAKTKVYSAKTIRRRNERDNFIKTGLKYCPGCEEDLTSDDFYVRLTSRDGLSTYCRECQSERAIESYRKNKKLRAKTISAA